MNRFDYSDRSLDIDKYDLNDILNLFALSNIDNVKPQDMKEARRIVLMSHPDKSGLDKKYFLFFVKAYERLSEVVDFKNRASQCPKTYAEKHRKIDVELEGGCGLSATGLRNAGIITNDNTVGKAWSKWKKEFDNWFDQHGELSAFNDGYDEFMKSTSDLLHEGATKAEAQAYMENKKASLSALVAKESLVGIDSWNTFGGKTNTFGQSAGEDLRRAYTETVVPVTDEDYKKIPKYSSLDEYKWSRYASTANLDYEKANKDYENEKANIERRELSEYYNHIRQFEQKTAESAKFQRKLLQLMNNP